MPCWLVERRRSLLLCAVRAGDLRNDIGGKLSLQLFAVRCWNVLYACGRYIADNVLNVPPWHVV